MKKYTLLAIGATAVTLLVCLLSALTASDILLNPFALEVVIPAVCMTLAALALTGKISLGICGLLTLVNLCAFGCCRAGAGGHFLKVSAWFVLSQSLILQISPVWFAAILVLGVVKKRPVVWALSALGLALVGFFVTVIVLLFSGTQTVMNWLYMVTGGSLALIALLAVCDWLTARKKGLGHLAETVIEQDRSDEPAAQS